MSVNVRQILGRRLPVDSGIDHISGLRSEFRYIKRSDQYECPAGERLAYRFGRTEAGKEIRSLLDLSLYALRDQSAMHHGHLSPREYTKTSWRELRSDCAENLMSCSPDARWSSIRSARSSCGPPRHTS